MDEYFWLSLGKHFLRAFFPVSFFLRPRRKYTGKKPRRNSVNENLSKVRRNTSLKERSKNYAKRRKSQSYTLIGKVEMISNTQNSIIQTREKIWKYQKTGLIGMVDRWVLVQVKKYIDRLESGTIWYQTVCMWDFTCPTFRKFEIFGQVGCMTCDMDSYKWLYKRL